VYRSSVPVELSDKSGSVAYYCWTYLDQALETVIAEPVLSGEDFRDVIRKLDTVLKPTALA
jgi:hypothetical protein